MTPELLRLQTYDRVFQRLVSTHKEIPLGIYRTCQVSPAEKKEKVTLILEPPHVVEFLLARQFRATVPPVRQGAGAVVGALAKSRYCCTI